MSKNDAAAYLEKHRIPIILNQLLTTILYTRPEDPRALMIKKLEELRNATVHARGQSLVLFSRDNLIAIFKIHDVTGKGFINMSQYHSAMKSIGAVNYNQKPTGFEREKVLADDFVENA